MGPILFYTFVNDLVDGTEHRLSKPEENTKLRDLLTYQMGVLPSWGAELSRLTKHADRNLMKFKGKRKVLPREGVTPCISTGWRLVGWKAALQRTP